MGLFDSAKKALLGGAAKKAFASDPLSQVAVQVHGTAFHDARCARCGQSFRYPYKTIFLPWQFAEKTIDVGGYCIRCEEYVCSAHAVPIQLVTPRGEPGWTLGHRDCGGGTLLCEEVRQIHEQKKAGG
jgi:hypothetical protein